MSAAMSIPLTIHHLRDQLNYSNFRQEDNIYYCHVGLPGEKCLIFSHKPTMLQMNETTRQEVFSTIRKVHFGHTSGFIYQLFCYCIISKQLVPLVQVFMMNRNYDSFRNVFLEVQSEFPYLQPTVAYLTLLKNERTAWTEVFQSLIREKFTDYIQQARISIQKIGFNFLLQENSHHRWLLRSLLALPLLPRSYMETGFLKVVEKAVQSDVVQDIAPAAYNIYKNWIQTKRLRQLSLYNALYRANNASIVVDEMLMRTIENCTDANTFKESMRKFWTESYQAACRFKTINNNAAVHSLRNDNIIKIHTAKMLNKKMSIRQFLKVTSSHLLERFITTFRVPTQ